MRQLIPILLLALTAACAPRPNSASAEPIVVTADVATPVRVECVPDNFLRMPPEYVDTDAALKAAPDAAVRYQMLWAGRGQRLARLKDLETVVAGCDIKK